MASKKLLALLLAVAACRVAPPPDETCDRTCVVDSAAAVTGLTPQQVEDLVTWGRRLLAEPDTCCAPPALDPALPLAQLAAARGFVIGTEVDRNYLGSDTAYDRLNAEQANLVIPGTQMKWSLVHYASNDWWWTPADAFVAFAQAHNLKIHGHTLVWHQSLPSWVTGGTWTRTTLLALLKGHIDTLVGRYANAVDSWDVVNEGMDANGILRASLWKTIIGTDYIDSAFVWTHRADPTAKLFWNDTGTEGFGVKSDSLLALIQRLRNRGVPIDGVGFETHWTTATSPASPTDLPPPPGQFQLNLQRFVDLGFLVRVSEMDVKVLNTAPAAVLEQQAALFQEALDACLKVGCHDFSVWGMTDRESWIPGWYSGFGRATPHDANLLRKPAADSLAARLVRP